jgi:hypothetical protein
MHELGPTCEEMLTLAGGLSCVGIIDPTGVAAGVKTDQLYLLV